MKSSVFKLSGLFGIAIVITLLTAGPANADFFQGCQTCGAFGCRDVADQSFGGEGCESYVGMNAGNLGVVCNPGPSVCYRDSISISVIARYLDNDINCDIWSWLMGWC